jgi:Ser/Thr protein kinase RdoA (MazF antagonist)
LDDVAIPRVIAHGDLHPTNILLRRSHVAAIIDWEFSQATQWPFFDWFQFLFEYNYELNKKERKSAAHQQWVIAAITDIFSTSSARARAAQPLTTSLFARYGLSTRCVPLFFTLYLLDFYWPEDRSALLRLALPIAFHPSSLYSGGAL